MAHECEPPRTPTRDDQRVVDRTTKSPKPRSQRRSSSARTVARTSCSTTAHIPANEPNSGPMQTERNSAHRIETSPFPDDDPVLVREHKRYNTYAYHEPDSDGTPLCSLGADQSFLTRTREHAHDHFLAPCQRCERIREKQEADQ